MRATIMYKARDVRIENVPDATIRNPTDAVIQITRACICGSDLWPYNDLEPTDVGRRMGHESSPDIPDPLSGRRHCGEDSDRTRQQVIQQGSDHDVRLWHKADVLIALTNVRFWGQNGR
jgi:hypothetical protein